MSLPIREALNLLDARTRRRLPLIVASFGVIAALDALGIGLVFPLMVALVDPSSVPSLPGLDAVVRFFGADDQASIIFLLGGTVAGLFLLKNLLTVLLLRWQFSVLFAAEADVGTRLLQRYLTSPWMSVLNRNSSELIRNASVSTSHVFLSFLMPGFMIVVESILAITVVGLLLFVDARVALVAAVLLLVSGIAYYLVVKTRLHQIGSLFQQANFEVLNHLKQGIGAGREIRVLGREAEFVGELRKSRDLYARTQASRSVLTQIPRYYLESVLVVIVICVIAVATATRPAAEVAPVLALFTVASLRLMNSASRILASVQQVRIGAPAVWAVSAELVDDRPVPSSSGAVGAKARTESGIVLEGVGFTYGRGAQVLSDVDLQIAWGECIGIVGPSGSGKSTLFDIMIGLLPPTRGSFRVDGLEVGDRIEAWRTRIGYVPQSVYLSDDTLRRNIAFGIPDASIDAESVTRAIGMAQLSELVASLPDGVDTRIGELGAALSGGQRQRVGIARALYHDPDTLFLDEATSALDTETEKQIVETLEALRGRKTLIVIAHRLSTLQSCDRILTLEAGRIVDQAASKAESEAMTFESGSGRS